MKGVKKRVVIIDDEPDVLDYLSTALTNSGFEVFSASNSLEGLKMIKEHRPDLVCLDILMPGKTGISIFKEIKLDDEFKNIPVLIISGLNKDELFNEKEYKELEPPEGYIEKPIDLDNFIEETRRITRVSEG